MDRRPGLLVHIKSAFALNIFFKRIINNIVLIIESFHVIESYGLNSMQTTGFLATLVALYFTPVSKLVSRSFKLA